MGTIDPRDAVPLTDEGKRLQEEYRQRMKETLAEIPTFDAEQMREATLATIGGADKATLARKLRRANAATRDAEQRAKESDARAERWRALVVDAAKYLADSEESDAYPLYERLWANLAATAPATQPDERAAVEAHHARIAQVGEAVAAQCAATCYDRKSTGSA